MAQYHSHMPPRLGNNKSWTQWVNGLCLFLLLSYCQIGLSAPLIQSGDVLAICGDSITAQRMYSAYIEEYLLVCHPVKDIKALQCGWGGTTAPHFAGHMKNDVLTLHPSIATVCFGMNDGGYDITNPAMTNTYRDGLIKLIEQFKSNGTQTVIIGSPGVVDSFYFSKNPKQHEGVLAKEYNQTLQDLAKVGKEVAESQEVLFADVHTPLMETMAKAKAQLGERYPVSGELDGVHGGPNEHLVIAYALLKAMGFDGEIGTITYDCSTNQSTASEGQRIVLCQNGSILVESSRYPFCFFKGNKDTENLGAVDQRTVGMGSWNYGNAGILPFVRFNEELNRYLLIVKNLKSPKARVSWGGQSKEYTAAELAGGINLAAEFLNNPFVEPFMAVSRAVQKKQEFESDFITHYLFNEGALTKSLPEGADAIRALEAGYRGVHAEWFASYAQLIKPVTHTIKIEPVAH